MKTCLLTVFGTVLVCCIAATHKDDLHKRIINGEAVTSRAYPHQASLQLNLEMKEPDETWIHLCGAVIIADKKLLTAAHCFDKVLDEQKYAVLLGTLNLKNKDKPAQFIRVRTFKRHTAFQNNATVAYPNDIATIHLESPIEFNDHVQPAVLAPKGSSFVDKTCVMIGWGEISSRRDSPHLMQAHIKKISNSDCRKLLPPIGAAITTNHICVFKETDKPKERSRPCAGDSGGPLMCGEDFEFVAGIASFSAYPCTGTKPSVYTRVSEYLEWISEN